MITHTICFCGEIYNLITALCAWVFQNYLEHLFVVKYVPTYSCTKDTLKKDQKKT